MTERHGDDQRHEAALRGGDEESRREAQRARDAGTIGRGMTSADSTEAPLSAETGEPDDRALGDRGSGGDR